MAKSTPIQQPMFDYRIYRRAFPLQSSGSSSLVRGGMVWEQPISGFNSRAQIHYLYNPSTVEADYAISDASVAASLLFPNPGDHADLRVPLSQTVSWSILFDRTYELWGSYSNDGNPLHSNGADKNNPQVVGVMADIIQMQQFTGMTVGYASGGIPTTTNNPFTGRQGIIQMIPSYAFFGGPNNLTYYGYISEWNAQITHWTEFMVPMRCVIDISFTMLPPTKNKGNPGTGFSNDWSAAPGSTNYINAAGTIKRGVSGR